MESSLNGLLLVEATLVLYQHGLRVSTLIMQWVRGRALELSTQFMTSMRLTILFLHQ